jgi:hypothetical protein
MSKAGLMMGARWADAGCAGGNTTAVKEDDSNIWVITDDEGDVEVVGAASSGSGGSKRKAEDTPWHVKVYISMVGMV